MVYEKKLKIPESLGIQSIGNLDINENILYLSNGDGIQKKIYKIDVSGSYTGYIKTDVSISVLAYHNSNETFYTHYSNSYSKNTFIHILNTDGNLLDIIDYSNIIPPDMLYKEHQPWDIKSMDIDSIKNELFFTLVNSANIYRISLKSREFINCIVFQYNDLNTHKIEYNVAVDSDSSLWITYIDNSQILNLANISLDGTINEVLNANINSSSNIITGIAIDNENFSNKCVAWLLNTDTLNVNTKELIPFNISCYSQKAKYNIDKAIDKIVENLIFMKSSINEILNIENSLLKKSLNMDLTEEKLLQVNSSIYSTVNKLSALEKVINAKFHKLSLE